MRSCGSTHHPRDVGITGGRPTVPFNVRHGLPRLGRCLKTKRIVAVRVCAHMFAPWQAQFTRTIRLCTFICLPHLQMTMAWHVYTQVHADIYAHAYYMCLCTHHSQTCLYNLEMMSERYKTFVKNSNRHFRHACHSHTAASTPRHAGLGT